MENTVEQLLLVLGNLFSYTNPQLVIICSQLNVEKPAEKTKLNYVAAIKDFIMKEEIKNKPDGGLSCYHQIRAVIKVNSDHNQQRRDDQEDGCLGGRDGSEGKVVEGAAGHHNQGCLEERLGIAGPIGESGQKDKLDLHKSIARQTETAVFKEGRSEEDIVEAILKTIRL